jgi:hypothetical protein
MAEADSRNKFDPMDGALDDGLDEFTMLTNEQIEKIGAAIRKMADRGGAPPKDSHG